MNEKTVDFQKIKKQKERDREYQEITERLLKRAEQKEKEMVSALVDLGDISEIQLYSIKDFLGENYIHYEIEEKDGMVKINFPKFSVEDFQKVVIALKEKRIRFEIEKYEER